MNALGCRARTKIRDSIIIIGFRLFVYRIGASDDWRFFTVYVVVVATAAATATVDASVLLLPAVDRIAIVVVQVALAAVPGTAAVGDLVIIAAAITVVCIVVVVVVVDAGSAAIGAVTATTTCAVTYARLWFDSYGSRHVVVAIVDVVRGGRSGSENWASAAVREAVRSVQRRPQLDGHLVNVRRRRRRSALQDTAWLWSFRR